MPAGRSPVVAHLFASRDGAILSRARGGLVLAASARDEADILSRARGGLTGPAAPSAYHALMAT